MATLTPLRRAAIAFGNQRLEQFLYITSLRYEKDAEVLSLLSTMSSSQRVKVEDAFSGLTGIVLIRIQGEHLEIDIPQVHLAPNGIDLPDGKKGDSMSPRFVKVMTAILLGTEKLLEANSKLRTVSFVSNVVNIPLADLLLELGFSTPFFGKTITREEVRFILTEQKVPPAYYAVVEKMRREAPKAEWLRENFVESRVEVAEKPLYSVPFSLQLSITE